MAEHVTSGTTGLPSVYVGGLLMGAADIVPGVSGGTVALLLGIYERLVANVRRGAGALGAVTKLDRSGFALRIGEVEWLWLTALVGGILTSVVLLTGAIEHQLEVNPIPMSGLFVGLVAGSVVIAIRDVNAWDARTRWLAGGAAVAAFLLLGLRTGVVQNPGPAAFFVAGAIAICAMILPGVSGSFLLLTMGMYEPLLDAVDARDLVIILAFLAGATLGLGSFSTLLSHLLRHRHDDLLAVLIGLMVGSIRVLWPWPAIDGVGDTRLGAPGEQVVPAIVLALLGLGLVLVIARIARARLQ
ncbi:MAG: putative membrane protein [Glaciecola sp.]|jgi:putative membrane protein